MARLRGRFKRFDGLVFYFADGTLRCANILSAEEFASAPILVSALAAMGRWRTPKQFERLFPGYSPKSIYRVLRQLVASGMLVEQGSVQHRKEETLAAWKPWGIEARFFHFASKQAFRRLSPYRSEAAFNRARLRESPQPALIKSYSRAPQIHLPGPPAEPASEFTRVLVARRTHREFSAEPVSLGQISELLWLTWGITGKIDWPGLGKLLLKTSPSGGARHPLEVYLWALRVEGLSRGVYHYRGDRHCLERVRSEASAARVAKLCAGQRWIGECAALFVMSAVFPRVMWRYRFSRAYRVVLLEAGHFCQTLCLAATWMGLAPFCTAALLDEEIEKDLGLDGARESVLYAAGVGAKLGAASPTGAVGEFFAGSRGS